MGPPAVSSQQLASRFCRKHVSASWCYSCSAARRPRGSIPRRGGPIRTQSNATSTTLVPTDLLLHWVGSQDEASPPTLTVDGTASTAGRCLRATRDQEPEDVLLLLPLSAVFTDLEVYSLSLTSWYLPASSHVFVPESYQGAHCCRVTMILTCPGAPAWPCAYCRTRPHAEGLTPMMMLCCAPGSKPFLGRCFHNTSTDGITPLPFVSMYTHLPLSLQGSGAQTHAS